MSTNADGPQMDDMTAGDATDDEPAVPPVLSGKSMLRKGFLRWLLTGSIRLLYRFWTRIAVRLFPEDSRRAAFATRIGIPLPDQLNMSWITPHLAVGGRILPADIPRLARTGITRVVDTRSEHKDDADALRVTVKPSMAPNPVESFTIGFADLKDDSATITLDWDKTHVPVALTTNTMEKVNAQIAEGLKKPAALQPAFYYQAASFYYDHEKDLEQAAKWIDTAIEKQKEPRYFYYYKKGQIEAKLGHKDQAKAAAEKSIELLKADPNPDETAIRNNQLLIDSLK